MNSTIADIGLIGVAVPILLVLVSVWVLFSSFFLPESKKYWAGLMSLIGLAGIIFYNFLSMDLRMTSFYGAVTINSFSQFLWILFLFIALIVMVISYDYIKAGNVLQGEYYFLLFIATAGLLFIVSTNDLMMLFISLEMLSISVYILAGVRRSSTGAEAAFKYFLLGSFGAAMLIMGIALIYGATGSVNLKVMKIVMPNIIQTPFLITGFLFVIAGFAFKVALVPFHMWVPDVYEGSPTSVSAFMAAGVKAGGVIALLRVFNVLPPEIYTDLFWWLSVITMIAGNLMALPQTNLKRLLAYSSVAHAGYILVGFLGADDGFSAVLFYLIVYSVATLGAFAIILGIEKTEKGATIFDIAGLSKSQPVLAASLSVFVLSLAGIPPMAGFFGKFYLFSSAIKAGFTGLVVIAVMMSAVSLYYYLRIVVAMYMEDEQSSAFPATASPLNITILVLMFAAVFLGFISEPFLTMAKEAVKAIL